MAFCDGYDLASPNGQQVDRLISLQFPGYGMRHPQHVVEGALAGADVATVPFKVLKQLFHHPLTDLGLAKFLEDAKKTPKA